MSKEIDNPLAFPVLHSIDGNWMTEPLAQYMGMTLRDYFAGQALAGLIVKAIYIPVFNDDEEQLERALDQIRGLSAGAYAYADAMLKARQQ